MNFIVTTTISAPTEATRRFAAMPGWKLVIVGDLKTPHDEYAKLDCIYLHPQEQERIDKELSDLIGWNCIQRRNMGFVYALRNGAEVVASMDDDNKPLETWGRNYAGQTVHAMQWSCETPAFDPLSATEQNHLWHRGFPVEWVQSRTPMRIAPTETPCDIHADLWHGDPDIDAICRATNPEPIAFKPFGLFFCAKPSPFNSQNTFFTAKALRSFFCFPGIGRFDDIWGSYVCQAQGNRAVYGNASVVQKRNGHDVLRDFQQEVHGYRFTGELVLALKDDPQAWRRFVPDKSAAAFDRYQQCVA